VESGALPHGGAVTRTVYTYFLGAPDGYIYSALGEFRSAEQAAARCTEARAVIYRLGQLWKNGVNYGCTGYEPVAQVCAKRD